MKNSTLCYIENNDKYLMLLRNKKKVDVNKGKWIGVGGKFEETEMPEECLVREVAEETGLILTSYKLRGIVTFVSDEWESECMFLYTADGFTDLDGNQILPDKVCETDCVEGELSWVEKDKIFELNLWEGDREFMKLLIDNAPFFSAKYEYKGDELVNSVLNFI